MAFIDDFASSTDEEGQSRSRRPRTADDLYSLDDIVPNTSARRPEDDTSNVDIRDFANAEEEPCMLSDDERDDAVRQKRYNDGGCLEDDYTCEICRVGDGGMDNEALRKVFELKERFYKKRDDALVFSAMAEAYNKTVYDVNLLLDARNPNNLVPWTHGMVEYHYEHCNKWDFTRDLWDDIEFMSKAQKTLRKNAIFKRVGGDGRKVMNGSMMTQWLRIHEKKLRCMEFTLKQQTTAEKRKRV